MSKKTRQYQKIGCRFLAIPHYVLESDQFRNLTHAARYLLILVAIQYAGSNNGSLVACESYLKPRGWKSDNSTRRCLVELLDSGLLCRTRFGSRNVAALYAISWRRCDVPPSSHGHLSGDFQPFISKRLAVNVLGGVV